MGDEKLALPRWSRGLILGPEHFVAQEGALLAGVALVARLGGLPFFGVGKLRLDDALLVAEGIVAIRALTVVFPAGEIVDVPGNATVTSLDLRRAGAADVDVYLHLLGETRDASGMALYEEDPPAIERVIQKLELSTQAELDRASRPMHLARMQKGQSGWEIAEDFVPPLLQVGTSPFLGSMLSSLRDGLWKFEGQLAAQITDTFFRGAELGNARRCQVEAYRLRTLLTEHEGLVHRHPFFLFDALRAFYLELCVFHDVAPDPEMVLYDHGDLAVCFSEIGLRIREKIGKESARSPRLSFVRKDNRFLAQPLSSELTQASEVYLVVQRARVTDRISLDAMKLASPERLDVVHSLSLTGIPLQRVAPVNFPHSFGPDVDFFRIEKGEEWRRAVAEGALAYYAQEGLASLKTALFWRSG